MDLRQAREERLEHPRIEASAFVWHGRPRVQILRRVGQELRPPLRAPQNIDRPVARHAIQPRPEPRRVLELGNAPVDRQPDFLLHVVGHRIADDAPEVAAGPPAELGVEGRKGLPVAGLAPEHLKEQSFQSSLWTHDRGDWFNGPTRRMGRALAIGLGLGLAGASMAARGLSGLVFGVETFDPVTFMSVPLLVVVVTAGAVAGPIRRVLATNPAAALRGD